MVKSDAVGAAADSDRATAVGAMTTITRMKVTSKLYSYT